MDLNTRLSLNAAIERLSSQRSENWQSDAQLLLDYGMTIPSSDTVQIQSRQVRAVYEPSESAYAAGIGNTEIDGVSMETNFTDTSRTERIGQYKVIHFADIGALSIQHYQSDGPWRQPETGDLAGYQIRYDSRAQPEVFAQLSYYKVDPVKRIEWRLVLGRWLFVARSKLSYFAWRVMNKSSVNMRHQSVSSRQYYVFAFTIVYSTRDDIVPGSTYLADLPL